MKKKKFFLDPKVVTSRANIMMESQIQHLSRHFGPFSLHMNTYYTELENGDCLNIHYDEEGKFLSKTFNTKIVLEMEHIEMDHDWSADLAFRGFHSIEMLFWRPMDKYSKRMVESLNQDFLTLNEQLLDLVHDIDLVSIELKYLASEQRLEMRLLPYSGAYVWVKLPPAYCAIPFKDIEVERIQQIVQLFEEEFQPFRSKANASVSH